MKTVCLPRTIWVIALLFLPTGFVQAETRLTNEFFFEDQTWIAEQSPYVIEGQVVFTPGTTLRIEEGVRIEFFDGAVLVGLEGGLEVSGIQNSPVVFTSRSETGVNPYGGWRVLILDPLTPVRFEHAQFKGGQGIHIQNGEIGIQNSSFEDLESCVFGYGSSLNIQSVTSSRSRDMCFVVWDGELDLSSGEVRESSGRASVVLFEGAEGRIESSLFENSQALRDISLFENSKLSIENSIIRDGIGSGITTYESSSLTSASTTLSNLTMGIEMYGGEVSFKNSVVENNEYGIVGWGGILATTHSVIHNNREAGVVAYNLERGNAKHTWWGDPSGPFELYSNPEGLGDTFLSYQDIPFTPWLFHDPRLVSPEEVVEGSSVVFIPGFQASRLYTGPVQRVWEPGHNEDLERLMFDEDEESVFDVVVGDPVDQIAFGVLGNIYKSFMDDLDSLEAQEKIADWRAFPYDWRYDPYHVVSSEIPLRGGDSYSMIPYLEELAEESLTGKVTIVGHSNGGLVGKALIQELENHRKSHLVDQFIMVGTPQLGTAKTLGSLLHGMDQEMGGGIIANKNTARTLGRVIPAAYTLLPSERLFDEVAGSTVFFEKSSSLYDQERARYGDVIESYDEMRDYLLNEEGGERSDHVNDPLVLKREYIERARDFHDEFDEWQAPEHIDVTTIVGTGLETIKGIYYSEEKRCAFFETFCDKEPGRIPLAIVTKAGDETVLQASAEWYGDKRYFDIAAHNVPLPSRNKVKHASLLEAESVRRFISDAVLKIEENAYPHFKSTPFAVDSTPYISYSIHSPVSISAVDSAGNRTGASTDTGSDLPYVVEEIPGSQYFEIGESKFLILPESSDAEILVEGEGEGLLTVVIQEGGAQDSYETARIEAVTVSENFQAELAYESLSDTVVMSADLDGDGVIDEVYSNPPTGPDSVSSGGGGGPLKNFSRYTGEVKGSSTSIAQPYHEIYSRLMSQLTELLSSERFKTLSPELQRYFLASLSRLLIYEK